MATTSSQTRSPAPPETFCQAAATFFVEVEEEAGWVPPVHAAIPWETFAILKMLRPEETRGLVVAGYEGVHAILERVHTELMTRFIREVEERRRAA